MTECTTLRKFYQSQIEEREGLVNERRQNIKRLQAQRFELNSKVSQLKEELNALHENYSYVGEVVKAMGRNRVLVKLSHEGKFVVPVDKAIKMGDITPNLRVAVRSDTYLLHKVLPTKVDPLVSLMKVEKVPDSTYDMIGGLDQQVKEVKEVIELPIKHPEIF